MIIVAKKKETSKSSGIIGGGRMISEIDGDGLGSWSEGWALFTNAHPSNGSFSSTKRASLTLIK
jgi:hypothetical protein